MWFIIWGRLGALLAGWVDKVKGDVVFTHSQRRDRENTMPESYEVIGITWNGPLISLGMKVSPLLQMGTQS